MESENLDLRIEIVELRQTIVKLEERIEALEKKEAGSGIYMDGVAEGYRDYIEKKLGGK